MIIVKLEGGLGNQFYLYALARCLSYKLNTELKIDISKTIPSTHHEYYRLNSFNVYEKFATPEEVKRVSENGIIPPPLPNLVNCQRDILIQGVWMHNEGYFADIIDIIRKEFTLKNPLSAAAQRWKEKILASECSVCLHFRYGDYLYNPNLLNNRFNKKWSSIPPLDYYYMCIDILKKRYDNLTAFAFSDNLQWIKENIRLDIPVEFVDDCEKDDEEFILMSLCKHDIIPNSTFSMCAASLNSNKDKKIFHSIPVPTKDFNNFSNWLTTTNKNILLDSSTWFNIPFDINKEPEIKIRPFFSLLLVVNNDAATLPETLGTILNQKYKYFELIIIDNASFDGSGKICQQVAKTHDNVTLIKLYDKVSNGAAWNRAIDAAQGDSLIFVKGNDRFFDTALPFLYMVNEHPVADIVSSVAWLREDDRGTINLADRKFVVEKDLPFRDLKGNVQPNLNKMTLLRILSSNAKPMPLATRAFKRKFLLNNAIRFDEQVSDDDAELLFTVEAMLRTGKIIFTPQPIYVAPKSNTVRGGVINLLSFASCNFNRAA